MMTDKSARTLLVRCECKNDYMDNKYGKGRRVANPMQVKGKVKGHRCASCATEHKS